MGAIFNNPAFVQHHDAVHPRQWWTAGGQWQSPSYPPSCHRAYPEWLSLNLAVQSTRRLIQHQDRRILQHDTRKSDPLALPARQLHAPFTDMGIKPGPSLRVFQIMDKLQRLGLTRRLDHLLFAGIGTTIEDVVPHRTVQKRGILLHHTNPGSASYPA